MPCAWSIDQGNRLQSFSVREREWWKAVWLWNGICAQQTLHSFRSGEAHMEVLINKLSSNWPCEKKKNGSHWTKCIYFCLNTFGFNIARVKINSTWPVHFLLKILLQAVMTIKLIYFWFLQGLHYHRMMVSKKKKVKSICSIISGSFLSLIRSKQIHFSLKFLNILVYILLT